MLRCRCFFAAPRNCCAYRRCDTSGHSLYLEAQFFCRRGSREPFSPPSTLSSLCYLIFDAPRGHSRMCPSRQVPQKDQKVFHDSSNTSDLCSSPGVLSGVEAGFGHDTWRRQVLRLAGEVHQGCHRRRGRPCVSCKGGRCGEEVFASAPRMLGIFGN